jgi:hypothetical protein
MRLHARSQSERRVDRGAAREGLAPIERFRTRADDEGQTQRARGLSKTAAARCSKACTFQPPRAAYRKKTTLCIRSAGAARTALASFLLFAADPWIAWDSASAGVLHGARVEIRFRRLRSRSFDAGMAVSTAATGIQSTSLTPAPPPHLHEYPSHPRRLRVVISGGRRNAWLREEAGHWYAPQEQAPHTADKGIRPPNARQCFWTFASNNAGAGVRLGAYVLCGGWPRSCTRSEAR